MKRMVLIGVCWLWALGSLSGEEHPNVQKARDEIRAVEYSRALELLEVALQAGGNDKSALVDVHRMLADSYVILGKNAEAKTEYKELLALEPSTTLGRISPKFLRVFSEAKKELNGAKLMFSQQINTSERNIVIRVVSDPTDRVVGARVNFIDENGTENSEKVDGGDVLTIDLPEKSDSVQIVILDRYDNFLETFNLGNVAFASEPVKAAELKTSGNKVSEKSGSIVTSWWPWAGLAAIGLGAGIVFEFQKRSTRDEQDQLALDNPGLTH